MNPFEDICVVINETPSPDLAENKKRTQSWRKRDEVAGPLRTSACREAQSQLGSSIEPSLGEVSIDVLIIWEKGRQRQDFDSACISLKPIIDGIADAGVIGNDDQIRKMSIYQFFSDEQAGRVVLKIRGTYSDRELWQAWMVNPEIGGEMPASLRLTRKKS